MADKKHDDLCRSSDYGDEPQLPGKSSLDLFREAAKLRIAVGVEKRIQNPTRNATALLPALKVSVRKLDCFGTVRFELSNFIQRGELLVHAGR